MSCEACSSDLDEACGHCGHTREVHDFLGCSMAKCRCAQFVTVKKEANQ